MPPIAKAKPRTAEKKKYVRPPPKPEKGCQKAYKKACVKLMLLPKNTIMKHLVKRKRSNLKEYRLGAAGATALQGRVRRRAQRQARTGAAAGDGDSERGRLLPAPTTEVRTAPQASVHHAEAVRVHVEHPKDF